MPKRKFIHRRPLSERFWSKVDREGPIHPVLGTRCWVWTGSRDHKGYGRISAPGGTAQPLLTHRVAYELAAGAAVPAQISVLHHCDNPPCVNPAHLFVGTKSDNMRDAAAKGRLGPQSQRQTHCKRDHELTPYNTYIDPAGERVCRQCRRAAKQRYNEKLLIKGRAA